MKRSNLLACTLFSTLIYINSAHALVDYSEAVEDKSPGASPSNKSMQRISKPGGAPSASSSGGLIWKSDLSFTTNYETLEGAARIYTNSQNFCKFTFS
ncbi:MAG: hypothetical protein K2Q18_08440, partial [Bdellovibrionales bacterium]|nr:hypothetical protein [Bdellovibrionales bacterium]